MNFKRSFLCLAALAAVCFPSVGFPRTIERIAAIAGDDVITLADVRREGLLRYAVKGKDIHSIDFSPNHEEDLEGIVKELVQTRLIHRQARKNNISVGDREVDAQLQQMYAASGQGEDAFKAMIASEGIKWEDYRAYLRNEIEAQYVIRSELAGQVSPSEADIIACAQEKAPDAQNSITVTLSQIMIPEIQADSAAGLSAEAARTLNGTWWNTLDQAHSMFAHSLQNQVTEHPEKFQDYVKMFSSGRSAERGGLLGTFSPGDISKDFAPVFTLKVGDIAPTIETSAGFHIIRVDEIVQGESEAWKKTMEQCRDQIAMQESHRLIQSWLSDIMDKNYVSIMVNNDLRQKD